MDIGNFLSVKPTGLQLQDGKILISTPFYNDAFFNRSVVLLTDHSKEGSAGLVLNKITSVNLKNIRIDAQVHLGGPVPSEQLFAIHNFSNCKKSQKLLPWLYIGYDNLLLSLIEHKSIATLRYKFFAGYSGWSAGQLDSEMERNKTLFAMQSAQSRLPRLDSRRALAHRRNLLKAQCPCRKRRNSQ